MAKRKEIMQVPMGETKVLLHTCCAPCSSAIIEALMKNGVTPVIYYCNPNIYPKQEYEIRKNECTRYAESLGLEIIDADYDHENWLEAIKGMENEPERGGRCLKCFKLRLLRTAEYACERGIKVITSTLASSRWKSLDQINEAGLWACNIVAQCPVPPSTGPVPSTEPVPSSAPAATSSPDFLAISPMPDKISIESDERAMGPKEQWPVFWTHNWRKGGLQERRLQIIKEYGFYNQLYCGCEFSLTSSGIEERSY